MYNSTRHCHICTSIDPYWNLRHKYTLWRHKYSGRPFQTSIN